jgi:hypothetical protein
MVTAHVHVVSGTRLSSEPLRVDRGHALGHLRVGTSDSEAIIFGTPERMRELAAAATLAAEQADELLRIEGLLAEAGMLERVEG